MVRQRPLPDPNSIILLNSKNLEFIFKLILSSCLSELKLLILGPHLAIDRENFEMATKIPIP